MGFRWLLKVHYIAAAPQDSKGLNAKVITEALNSPLLDNAFTGKQTELSLESIAQLFQLFENAKTLGSLIRVLEETAEILPVINERIKYVKHGGDLFERYAIEEVSPLVAQAIILQRTYSAVCMNPPYMGARNGMNAVLKEYVKQQFPEGKADLYSTFIQRAIELAGRNGLTAMVTMHSWMFLSSFEALREYILKNVSLLTMAHLGPRAFGSISGEVVNVTAFALQNTQVSSYKPSIFRLIAGDEGMKREGLKERQGKYAGVSQEEFFDIPGAPIAYWTTRNARRMFRDSPSLADVARTRQGLATSDNKRFLRLWHEVDQSRSAFGIPDRESAKSSGKKWFPCQKGGGYRKWYGNQEFLINWEDDGAELIQLAKKLYGSPTRTIKNMEWYFREGATWSSLSSASLAMRYSPTGFIFETKGSMLFPNQPSDLYYLIGVCNSHLMNYFVLALSPTLDYHEGPVSKVPCPLLESNVKDKVSEHARRAVEIAKIDWDSGEESWEFNRFPLCIDSKRQGLVIESMLAFEKGCVERRNELRELEESINELLAEAYGIGGEVTSVVKNDEITLYQPDKVEDTKRLISYAIGCIMGRYSLDRMGLVYGYSGNLNFDPSNYNSFHADDDGIVPVTDYAWFSDDATNRFEKFIAAVWGDEHLDENLQYLAENLGCKRGETHKKGVRRYFSTGYFKHHLALYKKRPIYWLFSSGKQRAFQCLVYLHRYNEGTLARMRTEYVIPLQGKIAARIEQLDGDITASTSTSHRKKLEKERDTLVKQRLELQVFDEKLRHYADQRISLDLDDGVKVNYGKFGDLLSEVKAVTGKKAG